jgi:hypothetical protein
MLLRVGSTRGTRCAPALLQVQKQACKHVGRMLPDERSAASVLRRSAWSVHTSTTRTFAPLLQMLTDDARTGGEGEVHEVP